MQEPIECFFTDHEGKHGITQLEQRQAGFGPLTMKNMEDVSVAALFGNAATDPTNIALAALQVHVSSKKRCAFISSLTGGKAKAVKPMLNSFFVHITGTLEHEIDSAATLPRCFGGSGAIVGGNTINFPLDRFGIDRGQSGTSNAVSKFVPLDVQLVDELNATFFRPSQAFALDTENNPFDNVKSWMRQTPQV
jgi:hypothetical protein